MTKAEDVKAGFKTPWWTATEDAYPLGEDMGGVGISVKYTDGGNGIRRFDPDTEIEGDYPEGTDTP